MTLNLILILSCAICSFVFYRLGQYNYANREAKSDDIKFHPTFGTSPKRSGATKL